MAEYGVQINVKVGDHLVNVNGANPEEAFKRLLELAEHADALHEAIAKLDGRPATEVVEKPAKAWGARGQNYYRGKAPSGGQQTAPAPAPSSEPSGQTCQIHGHELKRHPGGTNKAGKTYSASLRCPDTNCKPQWLAGEV